MCSIYHRRSARQRGFEWHRSLRIGRRPMFSEPTNQAMFDDLSAAILPAQYYPTRRTTSEGEYRLLVAVLENAVRSYLANRNARTTQQRLALHEVWSWFHASEEDTGLFGFESICELLGVDAKTLRERLNSLNICTLPVHRPFGRQGLSPAHHREQRQRNHSIAIDSLEFTRRRRAQKKHREGQ
jgi:hypothetical protein